MAERNVIKQRPCKLCGECVLGKAAKLKEHGRECKKVHEAAAAEAIMAKLKEEMLQDEHEHRYDPPFIEEVVSMADERVLNAEGD